MCFAISEELGSRVMGHSVDSTEKQVLSCAGLIRQIQSRHMAEHIHLIVFNKGFVKVLLIVVCPFVLFLLAIVWSVLPRYTNYDYPFGIFNFFLLMHATSHSHYNGPYWIVIMIVL